MTPISPIQKTQEMITSSIKLESTRSISPLSPASSESQAQSPYHLQSNCSSPGHASTEENNKPSSFRNQENTEPATKKHSKKLLKPKKYLQQSDISLESMKSPTGSVHSSLSQDYISPNRSRSNTPQAIKQYNYSNMNHAATNLFSLGSNGSNNSSSSPILNIETIINKMSSNINQFQNLNPHAYNNYNVQSYQSNQQPGNNKYHSNLRLVAAAAAAANPLNQFNYTNQNQANPLLNANNNPNSSLLQHHFPIPPHAYFANVAKYAAAISGNNGLIHQQSQGQYFSKARNSFHVPKGNEFDENDQEYDYVYNERQEEDDDIDNNLIDKADDDLENNKNLEENNENSSNLGK